MTDKFKQPSTDKPQSFHSENAVQYVTVKELCKLLKVSRQTVSNWRKQPKTGDIIARYIVKTGGRIKYDIEGLKQLIKSTQGHYFHGGKDYPYKYEASTSDEEKIRDKFCHARFKVTAERNATAEETAFYLEQVKLRDDNGYLIKW